MGWAQKGVRLREELHVLRGLAFEVTQAHYFMAFQASLASTRTRAAPTKLQKVSLLPS